MAFGIGLPATAIPLGLIVARAGLVMPSFELLLPPAMISPCWRIHLRNARTAGRLAGH